MSKQITIPKGKDYVSIAASGHKYVRILDAGGNEVFRSNPPAESVTAVLGPGDYTVDSDGKIGRVDYGNLEAHLRPVRPLDATKPPAQ